MEADAHGDLERAMRVVDHAPDDPRARANLATALLRAGRSQEAATEARRAAAADVDGGAATYASGLVLERVGEAALAEACYRRVLARDDGHAKACARLGALLLARGEHEAALALFDRAIVANDTWEAHANRGQALLGLARWDEADAAFERAVALAPDQPFGHAGMGDASIGAGKPEHAITAYERAIALASRDVSLRHRLGIACLHAEQLERALAAQQDAIAIDPRARAPRLARCRVLLERGDLDQAIAGFRELIAEDDADGWAHWSFAHALLCAGRLEEGWVEYAWRLDPKVAVARPRMLPMPEWTGESLAGRTIAVCREQGVGDQLLFAGLVADLAARASHVVLECDRKLQPLLARSLPVEVVTKTDPPHARVLAADCMVMAGSLARHLRPTLTDFPIRDRYLSADPNRVSRLRERLAAVTDGRPVVGFSWRSSDLSGERRLACAPIEAWVPLLRTAGAVFVCLQYDDCKAELARAATQGAAEIVHLDDLDQFEDVDGAAALIAALDLVITAPTTVSALAAALGVPTWRVSHGADWQCLGTDVHPWFPVMRRYDRAWGEPWSRVLARVGLDLERWLAGAGRARVC